MGTTTELPASKSLKAKNRTSINRHFLGVGLYLIKLTHTQPHLHRHQTATPWVTFKDRSGTGSSYRITVVVVDVVGSGGVVSSANNIHSRQLETRSFAWLSDLSICHPRPHVVCHTSISVVNHGRSISSVESCRVLLDPVEKLPARKGRYLQVGDIR